jgi:hypothetical protein
VKLRFCVAALLLLPSAAFAQGDPGPFGGLFGRTPPRTGVEFTAIDFRSAFSGVYEDAVLVDTSIPEEDLPRSGYASGVNTGLVFERQSDRVQVKTQAGATYQEFYRASVYGATSYDAALQVRAQPATRFHLQGQAAYNRSPYFRLMPSLPAFESPVIMPNDSFSVRLIRNQSYDVGAGVVSHYAKHSSLTVTAAQRETRFEDAAATTFRGLRMEAMWRRQLSRGVAVHAGYGRERFYASTMRDAQFVYELLDVGVDLGRQLSMSRRTTLTFATKTSMVKRPETGRRYRLDGHVELAGHFRRTWRATVGFSRDTEFHPGFVEPVLTDGLTGMVRGMLSPRAQWTTTLSAGKGRFGFDDVRPHTTAHTMSRLNWAITRRLGLFAEHAVYYHKLRHIPTSFALPDQLSRQAFAVGFNTWIPILNKERAPRDPE